MAEEVDTINNFLKDKFGIDTDDSEPIFRVVWSEDQFEHRETKYTDSGIELLTPQIRLLPKYKQFASESYILERRVLVPDINLKEMAGKKKSYEPLWVFRNAKNGDPIRPTIEACEFVIDCLYAALGKSSLAKYKSQGVEKIMSPEENYEANKTRLDERVIQLFGDESGLGGETHNESGSAVFVPPNFSKSIH